MGDIFANTLPIFLITLLGSLMKRKWLTAEEFWRGVEKLSYFFLFPTVLFYRLSTVDLHSLPIERLVLGLIIATTLVSIGVIAYRYKTKCNNALFTSCFQGAIRFNNYIFLGLSDAIFGDEGLTMAAVIAAYMIVYTNVLSILVFAAYIPCSVKNKKATNSLTLICKTVFSNPLIIASAVGFLCNHFSFNLHTGLKNTISALSDCAFPLGMLSIGAALKFAINAKHLQLVILTSSIKLLILPFMTFLMLSLLSVHGIPKAVGILYSCIPCASSSYILSRQLGGDTESMTAIITFSTIASVLSLSTIMYFFIQ